MRDSATQRCRLLERWSPILFLGGGGLIVGHAVVRYVEAFTALTAPPDVFAPVGYLVALIGLYGLYPGLVERTPRLARAAVVLGMVPLAGWTAMTGQGVAAAVGLLPPDATVVPGPLFVVHVVSVVLTYVLFGVASLRAGIHSRSLGLLLLAPPTLLLGMIVAATAVGNSAVGAMVVGGAQAAVHLSIGVILRGEHVVGNVETQTADGTTG